MTPTSDLEPAPATETGSVTINVDIGVAPYITITPEFFEKAEPAATNYLGAFLTSVEAFLAETPELSACRGRATFDKDGHVVEFNITLSVPETSEVAAAMRARDLLPGGDMDDYDERAMARAHDLVDRAVAEHLKLMARASGRLFLFSAEEAEWDPSSDDGSRGEENHD